MAEEETRAVCPYCESADWNTDHVLNSTDGIGIIQATCNDCGQQFEIKVESSTPGWSMDAMTMITSQLEWGEKDPEL